MSRRIFFIEAYHALVKKSRILSYCVWKFEKYA